MATPPTVIIEGPAMRESQVASGFVNERHFVLEEGCHSFRLCSYRAPGDDAPSKTWGITPNTTVSPVASAAFKIRTDKETSALGFLAALARQKSFNAVQLHAFSIAFAADSSLPWTSDRLTLGFEDAGDAKKWREAAAQAVESASLHQRSTAERRRKDFASQGSDAAAVMADMPSDKTLGGDAAAAAVAEAGGQQGGAPAGGAAAGHQHRSWQSVYHVNGVAVYAEDDEPEAGEGGDACPVPKERRWPLLGAAAAVLAALAAAHAAGPGCLAAKALATAAALLAALYLFSSGASSSRGGKPARKGGAAGAADGAVSVRSYMASVVVRAPPRACFHTLMRSPGGGGPAASGDIPFSDSLIVLETVDAHTQCVRHGWTPERGLGRWLAAPREVVALRTWRREPDGTYILLYQSTAHRKARAERRAGWLPLPWAGPVRARVQVAGFTISPLLPQYVPGGGPSQECLVTLVVKADLGGALAAGGALARLAPLVADAVRWRLLEPLLMSVVALRDRVEQRRFVVMPYTMSADGDDDSSTADSEGEAAGAGAGAAAAGATPPRAFQRTTTSLTEAGYTLRHTPLAPVAEESPAGAPGTLRPARAGAASPPPPGSPAAPPAVPPEEAWAVGGTTDPQFWSFPGASYLRIRGPSYLVDRVKVPAAPPMLDLYASDLVDSDEPLWNVAASLPSVRRCPAPFAFVLNLIYPANGMLQSLVTTWTAPVDVEALSEEELVAHWGEDGAGTARAFFRNFLSWMEGDGEAADRRRNVKFKLIPRVAQGSWVVRQSVGTTPVLLGQKLKTRYHRGRAPGGCSYFECDVDITSNTVANSVTRLVVNSITSLVVDLAPLVEGQAPDELPERVIGSVRYDHLDLRTAAVWDEDNRCVVARPPGRG